MKIGYLIPGCGVSGGVHVVCQHVNRLAERGHDARIITLDSSERLDWFPNQRVPVHELDDFPQDLDILVATSWATSFHVVQLPAKRKAYFVQSDEIRFHVPGSYFEHVTRLSYLLNFAFITEARWLQGWLLENFGKSAALVPNGLDERLFFPDEPIVPRPATGRILLEGAIDIPYKGMADAFEAVSGLGVEVWCVSSFGRPKPGWRCDRFFERVPIAQMRRIYSSCDVLLKMSRVEGFFGPPLEMMACGGTAVICKVTGYDEYVVDFENALVVEAGDVRGASQAVHKLLTDKKLFDRLVAEGRRTATKWRWDPSIDRLEAFFAGLIESDLPTCTEAERINRSISYFYFHEVRAHSGILRDLDLPSPSKLGITDADRLCRRLVASKWFLVLAGIAGRMYRMSRRTRAFLASMLSGS